MILAIDLLTNPLSKPKNLIKDIFYKTQSLLTLSDHLQRFYLGMVLYGIIIMAKNWRVPIYKTILDESHKIHSNHYMKIQEYLLHLAYRLQAKIFDVNKFPKKKNQILIHAQPYEEQTTQNNLYSFQTRLEYQKYFIQLIRPEKARILCHICGSKQYPPINENFFKCHVNRLPDTEFDSTIGDMEIGKQLLLSIKQQNFKFQRKHLL